MKKLIINADDFGISPSVNEAIIDCFRQGVLSSATLMVNMPACEEAIGLAQEFSLPLGLHFNLTLGKPLSDVSCIPSLVDKQGQFLSRKTLFKRFMLKRLPVEQIKVEFQVQLERFLSYGIKLDHIDSHQHIHFLPPVYDVLRAHHDETGAPLRSLIQSLGRPSGLAKRIKKRLMQKFIKRHDKIFNLYLISVFDYINAKQALTFDVYKTLMSDIPEEQVVEMMVHPSTSAENMNQYTDIAEISAEEYQILISDSFKLLLKEHAVELTVFSEEF